MTEELAAKVSRNLNPRGVAKVVRRFARPVTEPVLDLLAVYRLRCMAREPADLTHPVRVAFLLQLPEVWDKLEGVYEEMWVDDRFEPVLVALPDPSLRGWDDVPVKEMSHGSEELCVKRYGNRDVIFAMRPDGRLDDLSGNGFDYVFYQRPYDAKLPKEYRSAAVARWARVCYIPYCFSGTTAFVQMTKRNTGFWRNVTYAFLDNAYVYDTLFGYWRTRCGSELHHFELLGYPSLEKYIAAKVSVLHRGRLLWTPRWAFGDSGTGCGSHFMEYKDFMLDLARNGVRIRLRPHPLLWKNLQDKNLMSQDEILRYIDDIEKAGSEVSFGRALYEDVEWCDIALSDISGVLVDLLCSGRPIIFCPPPVGYQLGPCIEKLITGMYVVENWSELLSWYRLLVTGEDPKAHLRHVIVEDELHVTLGGAHRITERINEDVNARKKLGRFSNVR